MYFVKYGDKYLHDPRVTELTLLDLSLDGEENSCGFCDFTIYPTHPLYNDIRALDSNNPIRVYDDGHLIFSGFIYELGKEFYLDGHVKCKGDLAYLSASIVRPYSTAPNDVAGYLRWLINNHNAQVDSGRQFKIGAIQNTKTGLELSSTSYNDTLDEINSKILNDPAIGGYLSVSYDGDERLINYGVRHTNNDTQVIDFGVNLTSYTSTDDFDSVATYIIPTGGKVPAKDTDTDTDTDVDTDVTLTLSDLPDKTIASDFVKKGDMIYSISAVAKYGFIGINYSNTEIESADILLSEAIAVLKDSMSPKRTIEIKAIDMHLLNPNIRPIRIGEYIRVRSDPHGLDDYFLCSSISLDLNNPENSEYIFGKTPSTFTSAYKKAINDAAKNAVEDLYDDSLDDGLYDDEQQQLIQITVNLNTNDQIEEVVFVYEKIEPPEDSDDSGESGDSGIGDIIGGDTGDTGDTEESNIIEDPYACEYDANGRVIKFGSIDIVWAVKSETEP